MVQISEAVDAGDIMDHTQYKAQGNEYFKSGNFEEAIVCYTKALDISAKQGSADTSFKGVVHSNKSACYLKTGKPQLALQEATKSLEYNVNDIKALFRKCQALEQLEKYGDAYKDALQLIKLDPKNKAIIPIMQRLSVINQEKHQKVNSTESKVTSMFELVFAEDSQSDSATREQALTNLLVLSREDAGAEKICAADGISKLNSILSLPANQESPLRLTAIRILACLTKHNRVRAIEVINAIGLNRLVAQFRFADRELCNAVSGLFQSLVNGITNLQQFKDDKAKHETQKERSGAPSRSRFQPLKLDDEQSAFVDEIFGSLVKAINSNKVSANGRDNVLELIIRNVTSSDGLNWTRKFLETDGAARLMEVAGMVPERAAIQVNTNTRMHCSVLMSKIWDDTMTDQQRDKIRALTDEYFVEQFSDKSFDSKLDAVVALSSLLQGPTELGNSILGRAGVMDMLLALAESKDVTHQLIAVEALVHATSKKDKCVSIVNTAIPILKQMYKESPNDHIKARALVGMCKISSSSGTDAADKTISDESQLALSRSCRRFLANSSKDLDLRKWAVEGLAYLTLDAEIKEELVTDLDSIKALIEIAKVGDQTVIYPAASVFVNLMNAYDKPEIMPEMKQLAEYAKQKVPEEHPKDKEEYLKKRIELLVSYDVGSATVSLASLVTDSPKCKELLSRIFLAIATEEKYRGKLVQQGGGKVIIPLALENTDVGKQLASQALAKLSITINPEVAFPGQRIIEVIRPLLKLLHPERTALQNFEALLALTNITSVSESARRKILTEKGVPEIESYMIDDHEMLKRAATECICNLVLNEEVAESHFKENDKVKLLTLYCGDEDPAVQIAACGALAILSSDYADKLAVKIMKVASWKDLLLQVLVSENVGVRHRATHLLANLMESNCELSQGVVSSQLFEVLLALSKVEGEEHSAVRKCSQSALEAAAKHKLVKHVG